MSKKREYELSREDLMDIIESQNKMIEELLAKVEDLESRNRKHIPAVVENGVLVQLERFVI